MRIQHHPELTGKRVLITGASGFLGFPLSQYLLREGAIVGGLARKMGSICSIEGEENFAFIACDLENGEETVRKFKEFRPDILYHLAAHPDAKEELPQHHATIMSNILGTVNALEAFRASGGDVFIYGDSCKVYGDAGAPALEAQPVQPLSSYAIAKVAGWEYCKLYSRLHGLAAVSVRPTLVYGPGQGFNLISYVVNAVLEARNVLKLDGGTQTRDPLFLDDAIRAFALVAARGRQLNGRVVNISGGREISVADLARLIVSLMGSTMRVETDLSRMRPTETMRSYCDIREAFEMIGWQPAIPLQEGLRRTAAQMSRAYRLSFLDRASIALSGPGFSPSLQTA